MLGEELNSSYVTERGLLGDRTYAVVDQNTGKVASAKNPRKWGRLFDFRSVFVDSPQAAGNIPHHLSELPSRLEPTCSQISMMILITVCHRFLVEMSSLWGLPVWRRSQAMKRYWSDIDGLAQRDKVTDEAIPSKTFFDIAVIHIMTTSTINRLREIYPEGRFEVRRFRPNIVIESPSASGEEG